MNQILPTNQKIAFIQANWHADIVGQARQSFIEGIGKDGISADQVDVFDVPGSLEIPLMAKKIACEGQHAIIVACGLIVDGGIYRHDFVARTVIDSMMRVQLDTETPVLSVVLTPHDFLSEGQEKFFFEHFTVKGQEAAVACVQTLKNMAQFSTQKVAA